MNGSNFENYFQHQLPILYKSPGNIIYIVLVLVSSYTECNVTITHHYI